MRKRTYFLTLCMISALFLLTSNSFAGINSATPFITQIDPPPVSVVQGDTESSGEIKAFNEQQDITLASDVTVNITAPNIYDDIGIITPGVISAGTSANSHFLHFDPVGTDTQTLGGSVTFDSDILGVVILSNDLDGSDSILGLPDTIYPVADAERGLELGTDEFVTFENDLRTLTVQFGADIDQIRVITAGQEDDGQDDDTTDDDTTDDDNDQTVSDLNVTNANVKFDETPNKDEFELSADFTLAEGSNGIGLGEDIIITFGDSSITIPGDSLTLGKGGIVFAGEIDGADVKILLRDTSIDTFKFGFKAENLDMSGTSNYLDIKFEVGDDAWAALIRFKGELKLARVVKDDDEDDDSIDDDSSDDDSSDDDDDTDGVDSDSDGVSDDKDECPHSSTSEDVGIAGCDLTGVLNKVTDEGCTILDILINECAGDFDNRGQFVKCVNKTTNELVKEKVITGEEKGAINKALKCAGVDEFDEDDDSGDDDSSDDDSSDDDSSDDDSRDDDSSDDDSGDDDSGDDDSGDDDSSDDDSGDDDSINDDEEDDNKGKDDDKKNDNSKKD